MKTADVIASMDLALPDADVVASLRQLLEDGKDEHGFVSIELDEKWVPVPVDAHIELITKAFCSVLRSFGFSTGFRVQVAIGGATEQAGSGWVAKYCFATLFFNAECVRFTVDFHTEIR